MFSNTLGQSEWNAELMICSSQKRSITYLLFLQSVTISLIIDMNYRNRVMSFVAAVILVAVVQRLAAGALLEGVLGGAQPPATCVN